MISVGRVSSFGVEVGNVIPNPSNQRPRSLDPSQYCRSSSMYWTRAICEGVDRWRVECEIAGFAVDRSRRMERAAGGSSSPPPEARATPQAQSIRGHQRSSPHNPSHPLDSGCSHAQLHQGTFVRPVRHQYPTWRTRCTLRLVPRRHSSVHPRSAAVTHECRGTHLRASQLTCYCFGRKTLGYTLVGASRLLPHHVSPCESWCNIFCND